MTIGPALPADREAIYRLTCQLEETALPRAQFFDLLDQTLALPGGGLFVAREDGRAVGYLRALVTPQLHHAAPVAEILELVVDETCRCAGTGAQLLAHAETWAREQGAVQIELTSHLRRARAHRFYERAGFVKTSVKLVKEL